MINFNIEQLLSKNPYPGRGILIGRSEDNKQAVFLYFIMGRSVNSRNRVFEKTDDGIKTKAYDPKKLSDPSLVIYHPVRRIQTSTIVTNGDQTDTIADFALNDRDFQSALRTREYEPDPPNYTPRISGIVFADGSYKLSILKTASGNPELCIRSFFEYETPIPGLGHFISTYRTDGDPLPSFEGEPIPVRVNISDGLDAYANSVWESLNDENKVSLYACGITLSSGEIQELIINKNK